jgi:hypothetical protein
LKVSRSVPAWTVTGLFAAAATATSASATTALTAAIVKSLGFTKSPPGHMDGARRQQKPNSWISLPVPSGAKRKKSRFLTERQVYFSEDRRIERKDSFQKALYYPLGMARRMTRWL